MFASVSSRVFAVRDGDQALLLERISARNAMPILYRVGGPPAVALDRRGPGAARVRRRRLPGRIPRAAAAARAGEDAGVAGGPAPHARRRPPGPRRHVPAAGA